MVMIQKQKMINREGTKKIIKILIIATVILLIVGYALFESKSLVKGPSIIIFEPSNGTSVSSSSIMVKGQALRIKEITMNGRPISVDKQGFFNEYLILAPGYNVSILYAKDKFNRTIEYKLELVYQK